MKAGILTVSDRSSRGEREDRGGPELNRWLAERGVETARYAVVPDEVEAIAALLTEWADGGALDLILTTGGTGVSPRDVTPNATLQVADRLVPGFGERMRAESLRKTPMAILSRAEAAVRKETLIINLPGSPKGAVENLAAVWEAVAHAVAKIQGDTSDCAPALRSEAMSAKVVAVCISRNKGERKTPVDAVELRADHGIVGDAHAGEWHRQVSLLGQESIEKMQRLGLAVDAGDFAENITPRGIDLPGLPVGTRLSLGGATVEITQIGKECHAPCDIYHQAGDCVMPKEGIFAQVLEGGIIKPGDRIDIVRR